nr:helix-turn-helix transcriptional regulator [Halobacillus halophilus]
MGIPISIFVAKDLETDRKVGMRTRIKEFRARHDLTQVDLTRMVNVRRETIVFLEKGEYNPPLKLAAKISYQFHEPIEVVFLFDSDELH